MTILVEQIKRFALSVDYVTKEHFDKIEEFLHEYFKILGAEFYEIQVDTNDTIRINQNVEPLLTTVFTIHKGKKEPQTSIKNEDGTYTGQTTYAYDKKIPMWIVREDRRSLKAEVRIDKGKYKDLWSCSRSEDIPNYWKYYQPENNNIKTSIIIPLKSRRERTFGFLNLEFTEYCQPHTKIKKELEEIAESFSILWTLKKNTALSNENTVKALNLVRKCPPPLNNPMNGLPKLFLAYPRIACPKAMGTINKVLNEFSEKFQVVDWTEINTPGNITMDLINQISLCKYGICYFSEIIMNRQSQEQTIEYRINLNVTFEAGMFQSLTSNPMSEFINWIPIWEEDSTIPFDFAQQRAITVPRLTGSRLNEPNFRDMLENRIRGLLAEEN